MATKDLMKIVEESHLKPGRDFQIGDTVDVHVKIIEGTKERTQIFTGIVIARRGHGTGAAFTVRRLVGNVGVERVFPMHSPLVEKIEVRKHGKIRRAKLYYLRDRVGKATRLAEKKGLGDVLKAEVKPEIEAIKPRASSEAKHEPKDSKDGSESKADKK